MYRMRFQAAASTEEVQTLRTWGSEENEGCCHLLVSVGPCGLGIGLALG